MRNFLIYLLRLLIGPRRAYAQRALSRVRLNSHGSAKPPANLGLLVQFVPGGFLGQAHDEESMVKGYRRRFQQLACAQADNGRLLEVSRDAFAAGEEQFVSCGAEQSKYCSIYTVTLDPFGDLPSRVGVVGSVLAAALTV